MKSSSYYPHQRHMHASILNFSSEIHQQQQMQDNTQSPMHLTNLPIEIQDLIHLYLTPHDLTSCVLVNKSFHQTLIPQLWRTIDIRTVEKYNSFMTLEAKAGLEKHGHLVRTLRTRYYRVLGQVVLALDDMEEGEEAVEIARGSMATRKVLCTGLTTLTMDGDFIVRDPNPLPLRNTGFGSGFARGTLSSSSSENGGFDTLAQVSAYLGQGQNQPATTLPRIFSLTNPSFDIRILLTLLRQNHRLKALQTPKLPLGQVLLLKTITSHLRELTHVSVDLYWGTHFGRSPTEGKIVRVFLEGLSPTVEWVSIAGDLGLVGANDFNTVADETVVEGESVVGEGLAHPNLKELIIRGELFGQDQILLPFLQGCTGLQKIQTPGLRCFLDGKVAEVLKDELRVRPDVIDFQWVHNQWQFNPEEDLLVRLIALAGSNLEQVLLRGAFHLGQRTMQAILENCQSLRFMNVSISHMWTGHNVLSVLGKAAQLEEMHTHEMCEEPWVAAVYWIQAKDMIQSRWACTNLRVLNAKIAGIPRLNRPSNLPSSPLSDGNTLHSTTIEESHTIQRQVYAQLGALTRLKRLGLGVHLYDDDSENEDATFQFECLEMSLESGLGLMSGLKELEVLDVTRMDHRIGVPELEWMKENWPKLGGIRGMFYYMVKTLDGVKEWLDMFKPEWIAPMDLNDEGY